MTFGILPALGAGGIVGLVLGLVGGGGSILAVPLLLFLVGVGSTHVAIGTAALAVSANALANLVPHLRAGNVKLPCAAVFATFGVAGALLGAEAGKAMDGDRLLILFAGLMVLVGAAMLRPRRSEEKPDVHLDRDSAGTILPRLIPIALVVGLLSGFFGIGGGFLIVPGLMLATAMPLTAAIGTSLVAVAVFGAATSASYAVSGYIDWPLAGLLLLGGIAGGVAGAALGRRLARNKRTLEILFAVVVIAAGIYVGVRALTALG